MMMYPIRQLISISFISRHYTLAIALLIGLLFGVLSAAPVQATVEIPNITGHAFSDLDGDGVQDSGEEGIPGITIQLETGTGTITDTTTTASDGSYGFVARIGDADQDYFVRIIAPENYTPTTPITVPVTINGPDPVVIDFGLQPETGTITGVIFDDRNQNGVQDPGEPGIAGATVNLLATTNNAAHLRSEHEEIVQSTLTDENGVFFFLYVLPGTYILDPIPPAGYTGTMPSRQLVTVEAGETVEVSVGGEPVDTLIYMPALVRN